MWKPHRGLFARTCAVMLGVLALGIAVPAALTIRYEDQLFRRTLGDRALSTATTAALVASDSMAAGDIDALSRFVVTLDHESPEIVSALVADSDGRVIAASNPDREGQIVPGPRRPLKSAVVDEQAAANGSKFLQVVAPVMVSGESWGTLRIEIPLAPIEHEIRQATMRVLAFGAFLLLIGGAAALWLARAVARPVGRIAGLAQEVARGNLDVRAPVASDDEIGVLAGSFNSMVESLRTSAERIRNDHDKLESASREARELARHAQEASRAKSQFLANMSHEIRTPMNGVIGMTELLLGTELTVKQRRFANTVRQSADALLEIINDILDFSKIEAGKLELETVDFDLRQTLEDVAELLAERANAKGLELVVDIAPEVAATVRGDPGRLRQILLNLVGNAIKFTQTGEVVLRVAVLATERAVQQLRFEIRDTGIGIPKETKARIFDAFTQADGSTTRKFGGTGLGLAIAKQLVSMMRGEIGVESEVGHGSTFWFTGVFPFAVTRSVAAPPRLDLQGLRVLIVDDNATNRTLLHHQVSSWGMQDAQAEDASGALALLRKEHERGAPYDLVLLDMMMPEVDGLELAFRIKADPSLESLRLVLLTSMGLRGDATEVRQAGIEGYLSKPIRQSELYNCLVTVMGRAPGGPELVTRHTPAAGIARLGARILLVEDNTVNEEVVRSMLESLGCTVDTADDGRKALDRVFAAEYDAILMDCHMPGMDGFEATTEIRRREREAPGARRATIIALTANAMVGDREACLAAGMDDYLSKPVRHHELAATLARWVPGAKSEPQATEATTPAVDRNAMESAFRGMPPEQIPGLIRRMVGRYVNDTPSMLQRLRHALERSDAEGVYQAAHSLKSSSAFVGALGLSQLCAEIERLGKSGSLDGAVVKLRGAEEEFARAESMLSAMLDTINA